MYFKHSIAQPDYLFICILFVRVNIWNANRVQATAPISTVNSYSGNNQTHFHKKAKNAALIFPLLLKSKQAVKQIIKLLAIWDAVMAI